LSKALMQGWEKSSGHRKNLLDPDIFDIGIGVAKSAKSGRYYAVQDFGRHKSKAIVFKITNPTDSTIRYTVDNKVFTIAPKYAITHERCRPPKVRMQPVTEATAAKATEDAVSPQDGENYTIGKDDEGGFTLRKK